MSARNVWVVAAVLLIAAGCGRRSGPNMEGLLTPLTVEPPPIYAIIGARSDLMLTSEQVAALDSIAVAIQATNRPLIEELEVLSPPARSGARRVTPEGEPILEQIRANAREASQGVYGLLTDAQRAEVCEQFDRPATRSGGRARAEPSREAPADSAGRRAFGMGPRWYWCAPAAGGQGAAGDSIS